MAELFDGLTLYQIMLVWAVAGMITVVAAPTPSTKPSAWVLMALGGPFVWAVAILCAMARMAGMDPRE